jgi:hypothetical protein
MIWLAMVLCMANSCRLGGGMCMTRYGYLVCGESVTVAGFGSDCKMIEERRGISLGFIVNYLFWHGFWAYDKAFLQVLGEKSGKMGKMGFR